MALLGSCEIRELNRRMAVCGRNRQTGGSRARSPRRSGAKAFRLSIRRNEVASPPGGRSRCAVLFWWHMTRGEGTAYPSLHISDSPEFLNLKLISARLGADPEQVQA